MSGVDTGAAFAAPADPAPEIRLVPIDHPDAATLIAAVQLEYVRRYGGPDETPVDVGEFAPPDGEFFVVYLGGVPVAMAGWRRSAVLIDGSATAELKRMYVVDDQRGRGLARRLLAHLELRAGAAGAAVLILETGSAQPEAIALYGSAGYLPIAAFGHYADEPGAVHLGKRLDR